MLLGNLSLNAQAVQIAEYNDPPTTGTLAEVPFTIDGVVFDGFDFFNASATTANFCALPESPLQGLAVYQDDNWTITFDQPIENLKLYLIYWRGGSPNTGPSTGTFSEPGTLISGDGGISLAANGMDVNTTSYWGNGIIEFPGPISTLTFVSSFNNRGSQVGINFGISNGVVDCGSDGGIGEPVAETPEDLPVMPWWQLALLGVLVLVTVGTVSYRKLF